MSSYPELKEFIEEQQTYDSLFEKDKYTILYFTASWCGPCKQIYPQLKELNEKLPYIEIYKVDIDKNESIVEQQEIRSVPTFEIYVNKEKQGECTGSDIKAVAQLIKTCKESFKD